MSGINFSLTRAEHEKSFITLGQDQLGAWQLNILAAWLEKHFRAGLWPIQTRLFTLRTQLEAKNNVKSNEYQGANQMSYGESAAVLWYSIRLRMERSLVGSPLAAPCCVLEQGTSSSQSTG